MRLLLLILSFFVFLSCNETSNSERLYSDNTSLGGLLSHDGFSDEEEVAFDLNLRSIMFQTVSVQELKVSY